MPLLAAEDGASSDLAPVDLHTGAESAHLRPRSDITFGSDCVDLGVYCEGRADSHRWLVDKDADGKRIGETVADCATDVAVGSGECRLLAKDGATTAVERFELEITYGGNESRRFSADGKPWTFAWSTLGAHDFSGDSWNEPDTPDDGVVGVTWVIRSYSSNWPLPTTFGETTAAFFSDELPKTNRLICTTQLLTVLNKLQKIRLMLFWNNYQMFFVCVD